VEPTRSRNTETPHNPETVRFTSFFGESGTIKAEVFIDTAKHIAGKLRSHRPLSSGAFRSIVAQLKIAERSVLEGGRAGWAEAHPRALEQLRELRAHLERKKNKNKDVPAYGVLTRLIDDHLPVIAREPREFLAFVKFVTSIYCWYDNN
jgi:hypothetical protein